VRKGKDKRCICYYIYLTLCTFSLKLNKEASLIQGVWYKMLYHHKKWHDAARYLLCRTTLSWHYIIGMRGKRHQCKQHKQSDRLIFIHSYYISQIYGHNLISKDLMSIFPATVHISKIKALSDDCTVTLKLIKQ